MQTLLETDPCLLVIFRRVLRFLLDDLFDDLLRFLNAACFAQICDDAIICVDIDLCLCSDAFFGFLVLFELIIRNFREGLLDSDILSDGLIDSLNGILYVNRISDDHKRVLEGLYLIWDIYSLTPHIELSCITSALVVDASAASSINLSAAPTSAP